jgi:hypothetical protein
LRSFPDRLPLADGADARRAGQAASDFRWWSRLIAALILTLGVAL